MTNNMKEAFAIYYAARFPILTVQEQNGMFYCNTQEHYLTWIAATAKAVSGRLRFMPLSSPPSGRNGPQEDPLPR